MKIYKFISFFLVIAIFVNTLVGCGTTSNDIPDNSSNILITETKYEESFIAEDRFDEKYIDEEFIRQNIIYEDGIYEYKVDEIVIGEAYCFELTVGDMTNEQIQAMLPSELEDYDINWPAVIGKFAVGTTIIIAVGVVGYFCPSTYYVMATPVEVGTEALIGGAMGAALEAGIHYVKTGDASEEALKKYAIEGFADGYMWAAITSVLRISAKNFKRPSKLVSESGEILKIAANGSVKNAAGKILGKAYYSKEGIYILEETAEAAVVTLFDSAGNQIVNASVEQLTKAAAGRLPANTLLQVGEGATAQICKTDAEGLIFCIDGKLLSNVTYKIGNAIYKTDSLGRIVEVSFDNLQLKDPQRKRRLITNTINEIGKGFEKADDQRGHIIADRFDGDNTLANMVPMSPNANQIEYAAIEDTWAEAITNGKNVSGTITFNYSGDSFRPESFNVLYDIGKGTVEKLISNL